MCVPSTTTLTSDDSSRNHCTYPSLLNSPQSPSNFNSSPPPLTNNTDVIGYTNRITLNCNPREDGKYFGKFQHHNLTTISEESNINAVDNLERLSIRSEKSASSYY